VLVSGVVFWCALVAAEGICRRIDGFRVDTIRLRAMRPEQTDSFAEAAAIAYAKKVPRARAVSFDWYSERPQAAPRIPLTSELRKRAEQYPNESFAPFFEWNLAFLSDQACRGVRAMTMGSLEDFYYFESPDGSAYPPYRHLRRVAPPNWFVTNSFGWRGRDIALNKPANTIRVAFLGASTTIDRYAYPFSHPELIDHWLNRWASAAGFPYRFEVLNTGRTGIESHAIAAIVTQELIPLEPDVVLFYEGANQFWPLSLITAENSPQYSPPNDVSRKHAGEDYSVLLRRAWRLFERWRAGDGREPPKPPSTINWPAGVDEFDPRVDGPPLPMGLPNIVQDLDTIRTALHGIHAELVMSSFVWIVQNAMRLDLRRNLDLYQYLNRGYWPATYAEMRRLADFQNRVFRNYARRYQLRFIDFAAEYPQDPALTDDAIHFRYPGIVLEAWILLQHLIPIIDDGIANGRLPRAQQVVRSVHPAFDQPSPRLIRLDAIQARCH
jgi:hypothetical protein